MLPPNHVETKDTPDAPAAAKKELEKLGPMSRDEKITAGAFLLTVGLWIGGASLGVNSVAAATVGLAILLITGERCCLMGKKALLGSPGHLAVALRCIRPSSAACRNSAKLLCPARQTLLALPALRRDHVEGVPQQQRRMGHPHLVRGAHRHGSRPQQGPQHPQLPRQVGWATRTCD